MVSASLLLLAAAIFAQTAQTALMPAQTAPAPANDEIGVVRFAKGAVTIDGVEVTSGAAIPRGAQLETGAEAYAEVSLRSAVRVRVSASTRAELGENAIRLAIGRVWIQATQRTVLFEMPGVRADITGRSSIVAEHARLAGGAFAVRSGSATLLVAEHRKTIEPRQLAVINETGLRVVSGGAGLGELVNREAVDALGDLIGLKTFLLAHARDVELGATSLRGVQDIMRTDAELAGSDAGPGGILVEAALHTPPFFEEEVPPKGPNVRVEVTFGNE